MFKLILTPRQANLIARVVLDNVATGLSKLIRSEKEIALNISLFETEVRWSRNELEFICDSLNRYSSRYMTYEEEFARECAELFNYLITESRGAF